MLTQLLQAQALGSWQVSTRARNLYAARYLAVHLGRNVEGNLNKNYDRNGGPACNQVNLSEGQSQTGKLRVRADRHVPISSIDRLDVPE